MIRRAFAFALVLLALVGVDDHARADVVERVVAVVNDEAIFLSQLRTRAAPMLDRALSAASQAERRSRLDELYGRMLDEIVDEELIRQAAVRLEVRVQASEVERAIRNVMSQNQLTETQFWEAVRAQGYGEAQYRADVQRQLLRMKVMNLRVRTRVNITEQDVRREYDQRVRRLTRTLRFHAAHVFLPLPPNASAADVARGREAADVIRAGIDDAASFASAIDDNGGGDLGWLQQGELPDELEHLLQTLAPGEISDPVRSEAGFHIFLLVERESGGANVPSFDEAKEGIYREMLDVAMDRQERLYLEELRRDATIVRRL